MIKATKQHNLFLNKKSWEKTVDIYLLVSDFFYFKILIPSFVYLRTKSNVVHFTCVGIIFVLFSILFSCVSRRDPNLLRNAPNGLGSTSPVGAQPIDGPFYLKEERVVIEQLSPPSATGSIWGEAQRPRSLYGVEPVHRVGQLLDIDIPSDLKDEGGANQATEIKDLKMRIVGHDEFGNLVLSGGQAYRLDSGDVRTFQVVAKLPKYLQTGPSVSAKDLRDIRVDETSADGSTRGYVSTAWDKGVSRRIAGGAPDLRAATASLEEEKKAVQEQKKALEERLQGLNAEKDRLAKDKQRFEELQSARAAAPNQGEKPAAGAPPPGGPAPRARQGG